MTGRAEFMRPYLDTTAWKFLARRRGRRFDLAKARLQLREVIMQENGLASFKFDYEDGAIIQHYFDSHALFERVSEAPEWEPKAKMRAKSFPEADTEAGRR